MPQLRVFVKFMLQATQVNFSLWAVVQQGGVLCLPQQAHFISAIKHHDAVVEAFRDPWILLFHEFPL